MNIHKAALRVELLGIANGLIASGNSHEQDPITLAQRMESYVTDEQPAPASDSTKGKGEQKADPEDVFIHELQEKLRAMGLDVTLEKINL